MGTTAISSWGTAIKIGNGATPEVFTTVAEVLDISGPALGLDTAEVTSHDSPGAWEEFVATILRSGEVSFDVNWVVTGATHSYLTGLLKDLTNRTKRNFQIVWPNISSTTWAFAAFITAMQPSAPVNGPLTGSVTLKITGQPTLA